MINPRLDANTHTYYLDNEPMRYSVTQLISRCFPKFPAHTIAGKIADKRGITRESVLDEWRCKAQQGTDLHEDIHHYLNGLQISNTSIPFQHFLQFLDHHPTWTPMRTEMVLAVPDMISGGLAGSIDAWFQDEQGKNHLVDWKRTTKNLEDINPRLFALPPISHLSDSNFTKYSLQLNLYKRMLLLSCNVDVDYMWIVQLNPLASCYKKIAIPDLASDIDLILKSPE